MTYWMLPTYLWTMLGLTSVWCIAVAGFMSHYKDAKRFRGYGYDIPRRAKMAYRVISAGVLIPFWPLVLTVGSLAAIVWGPAYGIRAFWRMTKEVRTAARGELT